MKSKLYRIFHDAVSRQVFRENIPRHVRERTDAREHLLVPLLAFPDLLSFFAECAVNTDDLYNVAYPVCAHARIDKFSSL